MTDIEALLALGAMALIIVTVSFNPALRRWRPYETRRFHVVLGAAPRLVVMLFTVTPVLALTLGALTK